MRAVPRYEPLPAGLTLEEWARYAPYRGGYSHRVIALGPDLFAVDLDANPRDTYIMSAEELAQFLLSQGVAPMIEQKRQALQTHLSRGVAPAAADIEDFLAGLGL